MVRPGADLLIAETVWGEVWEEVWTVTSQVRHWGTIGLREPMLSHLTKIQAPYANELNVTDCQTLPKDLTSFAQSHKIHLWASGGGFGPG